MKVIKLNMAWPALKRHLSGPAHKNQALPSKKKEQQQSTSLVFSVLTLKML